MKLLTLLSLISASGLVALGAPPEFEVASVKVSTGGRNGVRGGCHGIDSHYSPNELLAAPPLGRCVITDGRLSHLISIAYGIPVARIKNAADWVMTGFDRFTIEAKAEDPSKATGQQLLLMLQSLLVERFSLKFHDETKDTPGFALVVGKNGPKLQASKSDETGESFGPSMKPMPGAPVALSARKYSMRMLAALLSLMASGPVVDHTGLTGDYDLKLSWDETAGPSLVTAVQEQLGLRLDPQKVPETLFVIESAQKPAAN